MTDSLPANFLQSPEWGEVNRKVGHQVLFECLSGSALKSRKENQKAKTPKSCPKTLMIVKSAKRGRYLEIPGGPQLNWDDPAEVKTAFSKIAAIAKKHHCVFVRVRPQLLNTPENVAVLRESGLKKAPMHLHAEHTVILDLSKSEDDLLKDMRRQTRYEVRQAAKKGIVVESFSDEAIFREFHAVQTQTAKKQHFVPPSLKTLLAEHEAFLDHAKIYVAKTTAGEPIAYGLILISKTEAEYFEAASTDLNRKLPGAYALQWQVIQDLKKQGIKRYNLWGIAPPGVKHHRYSGVTTFKTGFGGEIVEFVPAHDLVIKKGRYHITKTIELIRKKRRHL